MRSISILALSFLTIACAKQPGKTVQNTNPAAVDPKTVGSVVIAGVEQISICQEELLSNGASILYKNANGLFMVDKAKSDISLEKCVATVAENNTVELDIPRDNSTALPAPDIATLLRLIPAEEIGARTFVKEHPTFDGRGVIVGILDTGVAVDHSMLTKTSAGENKVIDFEDFSGEGRVILAPSADIKIEGATDVQYGLFKGSSLVQAEELAAQDTFQDVGVITYLNKDGKRRARIDTNGDKNFADETEIYNFAESRIFVKLGAKKTLTVSLNNSEDGKLVTLCFDDGSHGTHVAGITAGYDPKGLKGVAPGAQVVAAKIGDNRLSGGSTTTASMLLAIDFAVAKKAQVINLSYGIRSGSNVGKSTIDKYIDKVALEKNVLFSISAGNEGPGLLTVGTPAGANLAITNGAYVSRQTARDNYGYAFVEDDTTWYFSSVGPRLDGGWKPTLLAPGTALASVPGWKGLYQNYRGTSMASPHVTGGLALILSGAAQSKLPIDRVSVTRAVYNSANVLSNLSFVEQGHGLMNVPSALATLERTKAALPIEYSIAVNSPTSPDGKGAGIFVRNRQLPSNAFTVVVTPQFPAGTAEDVKNELKTFRLESSAAWIKPIGFIWMTSMPKSFQVELTQEILQKPGLNSGRIRAIDEKTGEVAFEVPVTVVSPILLNDVNQHTLDTELRIKVGESLRIFIDVPAGSTAALVDLITDGPIVWGQLLDPEGRLVTKLQDTEATTPQPTLLGQANLKRAGVYEIDLVAPAYNKKPSKVKLRTQLFSLQATISKNEVQVLNNFESLKVVPNLEERFTQKKSSVAIKGNGTAVPFSVSAQDAKDFSKIIFNVETSKSIYDLMTDYPYRVFDSKGEVVANGGMELDTDIEVASLDKLTEGANLLDIQGAFTDKAPDAWSVELTERRYLASPVSILKGNRVLIETGQTVNIPVNLSTVKSCAVLTLQTPLNRGIQDIDLCF